MHETLKEYAELVGRCLARRWRRQRDELKRQSTVHNSAVTPDCSDPAVGAVTPAEGVSLPKTPSALIRKDLRASPSPGSPATIHPDANRTEATRWT